MNIVSRLTWRQLKLNKKRTLVTIVGAIISVAMITAVSSLGLSFMDMMRRQEIADGGEWYVRYKNVNREQLEAIREDEETKTLILSRDVGYAPLEGSENPNKPYLFIREYNEAGFEKFPIELLEGRFPEASDEIVVSNAIMDNGKVPLNIGDTLTLEIGRRRLQGEEDKVDFDQSVSLTKNEEGLVREYLQKESVRTFTVVGIINRPSWEPTWSPGYTTLTYLDEDALTPNDTVQASVILKDLNGELFDHARTLAESNGIEEVEFNNSLLRYCGLIENDQVRRVIYRLTAIVMAIIIIGSISLIYNAFAISVSERSRYLGMLSSVGATRKQKRNSVFFEGFIIGISSIPLGVLAGLAGIGLTFALINPLIKDLLGMTVNLVLVVSPLSLLAAVVISALTIMISTWVPARRASNISAIEAIRQTHDYKLTGKTVKTSRLTRKLFGIEGELGLKNLKRNRTKYKATVFSLVISIVLFLVISKFTADIKKAYTITQDGINFDVAVFIPNAEQADKISEEIRSLENITAFSRIDSIYLTPWFDEEKIPEFLRSGSQNSENWQYSYSVHVNAMDDASLMAYAREIGADFEKLKDTDRLSAIVVDVVRYIDEEKGRYAEAKVINARVGEKLDMGYYNSESDSQVHLEPVEIAALTDKLPMGVLNQGANNINIIVSEDVFNKLIQGHDLISTPKIGLYMLSDDPMRLQGEIEDYMKDARTGISVYNVYQTRQKEEQMILLMSVFTYGFMALITAICIANILNTISTSIALRKREFAMLKSVGMTPKSFSKMINYESIFYGVKALLFGLPISFAAMYLIFNVLGEEFSFAFTVPWGSVAVVIVSVFLIVGVAMLYSSAKVRKENIIDVLKQEII